MYRRKGTVMGAVPQDGLRVVQGHEFLTVYRFNTRTAEHYLLSLRHLYRHRRRSKPRQFGYSVGCLEGVELSMLANH